MKAFNAGDVISNSAELQKNTLSQLSILIAEDNPANQKVLALQLELLGLSADFAENGVGALEKLRDTKYSILLTDVQMPIMDGIELTKRIRETEKQTGDHIPIIAITANTLDEDANRCLTNGMDDFISKPIRIDILKTMLQKWLPDENIRIVVMTEPVVKNDVIEEEITSIESPINIAILTRYIGNNPEKHCRLYNIFINSATETINDIQAAHKEKTALSIMQLGHKLKSPAKSLGALKLSNICDKLETAGNENNWQEIDEIVPVLDRLLNDIKNYIANYCRPVAKLDKENSLLINKPPID